MILSYQLFFFFSRRRRHTRFDCDWSSDVCYSDVVEVFQGDVDAALENFNLYAEYERSGIETLRTIAGLYEQKEDALAALRVTERALQFNAKDKDLLERKDRYYYSVTPDVLRA